MKQFVTGLAFASLTFLAGCGGTTTGGGSKAGDTFKIEKPGDVSLKHTASDSIKIKLDRSKDYKDAVKITFGDSGEGLTFDPKELEIKPSENDVPVKITATDKANLGDHTITITGKPEKGEAATTTFKVTVKDNK